MDGAQTLNFGYRNAFLGHQRMLQLRNFQHRHIEGRFLEARFDLFYILARMQLLDDVHQHLLAFAALRRLRLAVVNEFAHDYTLLL
ncbi:hypothetical protein D3C72_2065360 [compost metagenome]